LNVSSPAFYGYDKQLFAADHAVLFWLARRQTVIFGILKRLSEASAIERPTNSEGVHHNIQPAVHASIQKV
jgi:hypothetical protein